MTDVRSLAFNRHHALALVLSVAAHLGLCMMTGMSGGMAAGSAELTGSAASLPLTENRVTVQLSSPDSPEQPSARSTVVANQLPEISAVSSSHSPASLPQRAAEPAALQTPDLAPSPVRYFLLPELTQEPQVAAGLMDGRVLRVSKMTPHTLTCQVWVNDRGEVDKVVLENSDLPAEDEQLVIENFLRVKFYPARIGRIAVSSQLQMEVMLDDLLPI